MSNISPKTPGLVTIRYIVMSILNRVQDYSLKSYKRLIQITIEGFTELNLWHINAGVDVVYLHMSLAKTVNIPVDFIDWTKVGFPIGGELRVITNNDNILLPRVFDDTGISTVNATSEDANNISDPIFFSGHWRGSQYVGGLYGLPGGIDRAYFRFDMERRQIVFSGTTPRSEIVLEYMTTGIKNDGTSLIPREVVPALRTYTLWQMIENDQRIAYNEKERRKRDHEEAINALRSFTNAFTAEEYLQMFYSTTYQAPKR